VTRGLSATVRRGLTHGQALAGMLLVTLMWSTAGVVTRQLEEARSFEVTFWRSWFLLVALGCFLLATQGRAFVEALRRGGRVLWLSGACWCAMFTCFMVAITITTVANVLITLSVAPLFTALLGRFLLGTPIPRRTWVAIAVAGAGIGWMYGASVATDGRALLGTLVALGVPIAAAVNWIVLQQRGGQVDLAPALVIGAALSCAITLPLAWPLDASPTDLGWLAFLGVFQLAVPCLIAVKLSRHLPAAEIALLALLEVVFGIAWAWLGAGERPEMAVLLGGALVLGALAVNQLIALREGPANAPGRSAPASG
jgi:drug/metabolite transporter (DMT)-like permease